MFGGLLIIFADIYPTKIRCQTNEPVFETTPEKGNKQALTKPQIPYTNREGDKPPAIATPANPSDSRNWLTAITKIATVLCINLACGSSPLEFRL